MKDNAYLYFDSQPHIEDTNRIVRFPNNSLVIYNLSVNDSSDHYKCSILRKPSNLNVIHRLRVEPERTQQSIDPPQQSHNAIIRVIPAKKVEVMQGHAVRIGCETENVEPPPEIKWFISVKNIIIITYKIMF